MKLRFLLLAAVAFNILFCFSCKKKPSNAIYIAPPSVYTNNGSTAKKTMKDFFVQTKAKSQVFSGDAGSGLFIEGDKGSRVFIPAGSLIHKDGTPVTGAVDIELIEIFTLGEMILSNVTPTSGGQLLQSGGEIYIMARQNGEDLRINKTNPVTLLYPTNDPQSDMTLFRGNFIPNPALASDSVMDWTEVDDKTAEIVQDSAFGGTNGGYTAYSFLTDSFGWSNCDRFWNLTGGTDPMVSVPDSFDNKNTCVYMIFDSEHALATADIFSNQIFRFHSGEHTPIGLNVTIVAISKRGDKYYYDINHEVTEDGKVFTMDMQEATLDEIETAVGAL